MYNIEEIFKKLSKEKKELKPKYVYKTAEEGLLRAHHFFRWCNKNQLNTIELIVQKFEKKKVPEQQLEHFGVALTMIEHYNTDINIKNALIEIKEQVKQKTKKNPIDLIEPEKVQKRILKNIYKIFNESIKNLKERSIKIKKASKGTFLTIFILLFLNIILTVTGIYSNILSNITKSSPFINNYGEILLAALLFIIPSLIIFIINRHKISEHSQKGNDYPKEINDMEKALKEYSNFLKEKNVNI